MANAFLNAGATSLAAANWSDTTGYDSGTPTLYVQTGSQSITGGLAPASGSYAALYNFDVLSGFSGAIGGPAGSFAIETANAAFNQATQLPRVRYWASGGQLYYTPQGADAGITNECHYFQIAGSGSGNINGTGIVRRVEVESGRGYVAPTVDSVATYRWTLTGGAVIIDGAVGSTKIHSLTIAGGQHTLKRGIQGGTVAENSVSEGLNVYGGQVTIDAYGETIAKATVAGTANVRVLNCGTITYLGLFGGKLDFSALQRPLTITTLAAAPGATVVTSPLLTITNYYPIGSGAEGLT